MIPSWKRHTSFCACDECAEHRRILRTTRDVTEEPPKALLLVCALHTFIAKAQHPQRKVEIGKTCPYCRNA